MSNVAASLGIENSNNELPQPPSCLTPNAIVITATTPVSLLAITEECYAYKQTVADKDVTFVYLSMSTTKHWTMTEQLAPTTVKLRYHMPRCCSYKISAIGRRHWQDGTRRSPIERHDTIWGSKQVQAPNIFAATRCVSATRTWFSQKCSEAVLISHVTYVKWHWGSGKHSSWYIPVVRVTQFLHILVDPTSNCRVSGNCRVNGNETY